MTDPTTTKPRTNRDPDYVDKPRQKFDAALDRAIRVRAARYRALLRDLSAYSKKLRVAARDIESFRNASYGPLAKGISESVTREMSTVACSIDFLLGLQRRLRSESDFGRPQLRSFIDNWQRTLVNAAIAGPRTAHDAAAVSGLASAVAVVAIIAEPYLTPDTARPDLLGAAQKEKTKS